MLRELLTNPVSYFEERIKYPTLRPQAVIVFVAGLAANIWYPALFIPLGATAEYVESVLWIMPALGIVEFFLVWVLLTAVMNGFVMLLGADPSYGRLLRLTGYGFVPMILGGVIWSAGRYMALQAAPPPDKPQFFGTPGFRQRYGVFQEFVAPILTDPVFIGSLVVGSFFVVVSAYFWLLAVEVMSGLDRNRAGIVVLVPTVLYLVWVFIPLL